MINLLKNLVKARSTADVGELEAAKVLADYFKGLLVEVNVDNFDGDRANCNVHVRSTGEKPALLFAAHIDVVPPGDQKWDFEPFAGLEQDGKILGRGTTDMKAGLAATAAAISEILAEGTELKGDIVLTASAGEETDSCGILRFLDNNFGDLPPIAGIVIPEPTNFDIVTAHRGILWLTITTKGKTAHGSMPHEGINAVLHMATLINALKDFKIDYPPHPIMGPCTMSINQVHGGKATNVIPDNCTINIDIRPVPDQPHQDIIDQLQAVCDKLTAEDKEFQAEIKIDRSVGAMESDNDSQFIKDFSKITTGAAPITVGYTTDASNMTDLNIPITIFGPGDTSVCHKPNEFVVIKEVVKAKEYYKKIIRHYLT
ncbi:MAG: M20 family metallopeptidase [Phycisphaerae bacterium]|nr:M20 family metallopeptidase [Phycisphaerae bacterium]